MFSIAELTILIATVGLVILAYFKWTYTYWKRRNLKQLEPSIPFGNTENPFRIRRGLFLTLSDIYEEFKSKGYKHGGLYIMTRPVYMPVDPEYIKNVLAKDFQHFVDRGVYYNEKADPLSAHLFSLEGQKWRLLRNKLTPTFTSGKIKMMFQTLLDCGVQLNEEIDKLQSKRQALDVKEIVACFSTDVIGSCAFGLDCNSFKDPDAEFRKNGKKIFVPSLGRLIRLLFTLSAPRLCKIMGMAIFPKDVTKFFMNAVKNIVKHRESNKVVRNDFVQILLELKNKTETASKRDDLGALTIEEMAAQAFVFFVAGFETSSTTMTFCMYELAKNQQMQQKLRDEINSVLQKYRGETTYEGLKEMTYLAQVIDETLRKYPPVPSLTRMCTQKYKVPDTDVVLEAGTKVLISVYGIQHDPEYYPDPERFDPDRFTEENKAKRHQFTHLPFGSGPRNCIGLRFGLMQTKIGLVVMLKNYKFTLNEKTPECVRINPRGGLMSPMENILLDVHKITD